MTNVIHWPVRLPPPPNFTIPSQLSRYSRTSSVWRLTTKDPIIHDHPLAGTEEDDNTVTDADLDELLEKELIDSAPTSTGAYVLVQGQQHQRQRIPKRASLLGLPLELRHLIYDYINAGQPRIKPVVLPSLRPDFLGNSLLRVSKQIYSEYKPTLVRTMDIRLDLGGPPTRREVELLRTASNLTIWDTLPGHAHNGTAELRIIQKSQISSWAKELVQNPRIKSLRILISQACFFGCPYDYGYRHTPPEFKCAHLEAFKAATIQLGDVVVSEHVSIRWDPTFLATPSCSWLGTKVTKQLEREIMAKSKARATSKREVGRNVRLISALNS
jgi:hypothetical protein